MFLLLAALTAALASQAGRPCDLRGSDVQRQSGEHAFEKRQFADAAKSFQAAYDLCPSQHAMLLRLSESDLRRHDPPAAVEAARQFLRLEPDSIAGKLAVANALLMAQRWQEALNAADSILQENHNESEALKIKANVQYLSGHSEEAVSTFLTLLDQHPTDQEGAYMLGRIYYQEGRIEQAAGLFQRVLKMNPKSFKALDNLGLCFEALGEKDTAARYFLTAIKTAEEGGETYDWAYANLANLLLEKGDAVQAFAAASKATNRNPYSARDFYLGGKALQQLGKDDLSIRWLERSAALDPKYPDPLYLLGRVYMKVGQKAKAEAALEKFRTVKAAAPRERK